MDFENTFNSVSHENLWTVLRAFEIPDLDLLEAIYSVATVSLAGVGGGDLPNPPPHRRLPIQCAGPIPTLAGRCTRDS